MSNVQYLGTGEGASTMDRSTRQFFLAGAAIVAGDWVMLDASQTLGDQALYVLQADVVAHGNQLVVGVALNAAAAAGDRVEVCIGGYCKVANVTTAIASAIAIVIDATAGRGDVAAATDLASPCGTVLTVAAGNVAEVWVHRKF